ncbi:MAG: CerR family C-terminal domain-containing protein [Sneathiellales bacterium]|nr:CerR family C-terminal domain-containing protein [Sneathiellales bacterium]
MSAADRLIEAAGPLFADQPFNAVSTREIAKAAGVNLSAISYHFGNKEGLYEAVFHRIIEDLAPARNNIKSFLEGGVIAAKGSVAMQREIVSTFVSAIIDAITEGDRPKWRMQLIVREIHGEGPCFKLVMQGHIEIMHDMVGKLVAVILKEDAETPRVKLIAHSILALCLQYALNEALISYRLGWPSYGPDEKEILKKETSGIVFSILGIADRS